VDAWERALAGPRCELLTIVGDPGVGKSRLVEEALERIAARVVRGRCLSYGEGITYWPVVEVVKQMNARPDDEQAAAAIDSLVGESEMLADTDEIGWAFRKLLEAQAPLVVCFDDIQWGEETFLDLVESTALLSTGSPVLLLCMARLELLDRRPGWPAMLRLDPLMAEETEALVGDAVPDDVRERIVHASGGNPLFVTEMLSLAGETSDVEVPTTLRALLAARLDQLDGAERAVLERGAVEGELFHRGSVQALAPEQTEVTPRLAALVRRDLVRPDQPQLPREDAFRFRHLLIRDAAYDALPKATRAELHCRFADWLEEHGQTLIELDEILGYHLEQAARYLAELGRPDSALAGRASRRLATAGERMYWRQDTSAAHSLMSRAMELVDELDTHAAVVFALTRHDTADRERLLEEAARRADARADVAGAAFARALAAGTRVWLGVGTTEEAEQLARAALPLLEAAQDHGALAQTWFALANGAYNGSGRFTDIVDAAEMARRYETLLGRPHHRTDGLCAMGLMLGAHPVTEALERLDALGHAPFVEMARAVLLAMADRFAEARELAENAEARAREWDSRGADPEIAEIESLAGNHDAAAARFGSWRDIQAEQGAPAGVATYSGLQGRELCLAGRCAEAEQDAVPDIDPDTQSPWQWQVAALVSSHRGDHAAAEKFAQAAVSHLDGTQSPKFQADAYCDLAEVLHAAGRQDEALVAWHEALERYERKGIIPLARRTRERLAAMAGDTVP
jgi:predicted ATPase